MIDPTRADQPRPEQTAWVGRATPPPPTPPPPSDPFWPPLEGQPAPHGPGYPPVVIMAQPPRRRRGLTVVLLVVGVLAACCAGGVTLAVLGNLAPQSSLGSAPPGLNTPVEDGKFRFVVTSVSCGHASVGRSFITKQAQGQFCIVDLSVENIGTEAQMLVDGFQKALGPDGTTYGPDSQAGVIANESGAVVWNLINPGNKVTGKIVYDIPEDDSIAKLELHDSLLSGGVSVTVS